MRYFDREQVSALLDMQGCINLMKDTLVDYSYGRAIQTLRTAMPISPAKILGVMPAANPRLGVTGAKIITVFPDNFQRGLPSHQGAVVLFDIETGSLKAFLDGEGITGIRTAAVSAAATDALARPDAHVLCLLGSGLQARRHLEAIRLVRAVDEVRVWDINPDSVRRFQSEMQAAHGIPIRDCCGDVRAAVNGADIICTVTAAREPVLFGAHLSPGAHVNAVGACGARYRELDTEAICKSRFFCDSRESCMNEAGDFLIPLRQGEVLQEHLLGEIGRVLSLELPGRVSPEDITVFEAQGLAAEDLSAADYIFQKSKIEEEKQ